MKKDIKEFELVDKFINIIDDIFDYWDKFEDDEIVRECSAMSLIDMIRYKIGRTDFCQMPTSKIIIADREWLHTTLDMIRGDIDGEESN